MKTTTLQEAQEHLPDLIATLAPLEELVILDEGKPLAKITRAERTEWPCQAGSARDTDHWMAPDFNAPLEDFREYME